MHTRLNKNINKLIIIFNLPNFSLKKKTIKNGSENSVGAAQAFVVDC